MIIYIIGDSHSSMFNTKFKTDDTPLSREVVFRDKSQGFPKSTAYSISYHDQEIRALMDSFGLQNKDEVWFVYGEIDVRFHIFYHHQKLKISLDESISNVVNKYVPYIKSLRDQGYNVHIVSVVPPQPNSSPFHWDPTYEILNPIRGDGITVADRVYITEKLNSEMKKACEEYEVPFRDLYPFLVDPETGCNIPEMTRDEMHYNYIGNLVIEKLGLAS